MQILTIAGNVGKDAVLRQTQGGDPVLNFSVAVNNGKDSEGRERPASWFDCALWGKRATALEPYIRKGDKITLSGRPTTRAHEGKAYLGVNVDQLTLQGGSQGGDKGGQRDSDQGSGYGAGSSGGGGYDDTEIPFAPETRA